MPVRCPPASVGSPQVRVGMIILAVPDPCFLCEGPRRGDPAPGRPRTPGSGDRYRRIRDRCSGSSAYTRQRSRDRACPEERVQIEVSSVLCTINAHISLLFSCWQGSGTDGHQGSGTAGFLPCEREKNTGPSFEMELWRQHEEGGPLLRKPAGPSFRRAVHSLRSADGLHPWWQEGRSRGFAWFPFSLDLISRDHSRIRPVQMADRSCVRMCNNSIVPLRSHPRFPVEIPLHRYTTIPCRKAPRQHRFIPQLTPRPLHGYRTAGPVHRVVERVF